MAFDRFLTAISPVNVQRHRVEHGVHELRERIWRLQQLARSPFADAPMAHMVRLQVIETLRGTRGDRKGNEGPGPYLLFVAELDGHPADFLDWLYACRRDLCTDVWGLCTGGEYIRDGAVFFRRYIERCRVPVQLGYAGYDYTVDEICDAVRLRLALSEQIRATQGADDASLLRAWRAFVTVHDRLDGPTPRKENDPDVPLR